MSDNLTEGLDIPEGLFLTTRPSVGRYDEAIIADAGDLTWVIFTRGGREDPADWFRTTVSKTCAALGVTEAFWDTEQVTVEEFITRYIEKYDLGIHE